MISIEKAIEAGREVRFLEHEDKPQLIQFRAPHRAPLGTPQFFDDVRNSAVAQYVEEVWTRNGIVQGVEEKEVKARHTHGPDVEEQSGCLACTLEQRVKDGKKPAVRMMMNVLRNKEPLTLVEQPVPAKQHKKKRWMSDAYHLRIQKKWNKKVRGLTHMVPEQETVVLSVSPAMYHAIRDAIVRAKDNRHALI